MIVVIISTRSPQREERFHRADDVHAMHTQKTRETVNLLGSRREHTKLRHADKIVLRCTRFRPNKPLESSPQPLQILVVHCSTILNVDVYATSLDINGRITSTSSTKEKAARLRSTRVHLPQSSTLLDVRRFRCLRTKKVGCLTLSSCLGFFYGRIRNTALVTHATNYVEN